MDGHTKDGLTHTHIHNCMAWMLLAWIDTPHRGESMRTYKGGFDSGAGLDWDGLDRKRMGLGLGCICLFVLRIWDFFLPSDGWPWWSNAPREGLGMISSAELESVYIGK